MTPRARAIQTRVSITLRDPTAPGPPDPHRAWCRPGRALSGGHADQVGPIGTAPLLTTLLIYGVPLLLIGTFVSTVFGGTSREERTEAAPDRIRMTTSGGAAHEVTLAPGGRPDRTVSVG